MNSYHVSIPTTLVYFVEAKDEEDANYRVAMAIGGNPVDPRACWVVEALAEQQAPPWDVEEIRDCAWCGDTINDGCNCNG